MPCISIRQQLDDITVLPGLLHAAINYYQRALELPVAVDTEHQVRGKRVCLHCQSVNICELLK